MRSRTLRLATGGFRAFRRDMIHHCVNHPRIVCNVGHVTLHERRKILNKLGEILSRLNHLS